jgi:hypothetical protein
MPPTPARLEFRPSGVPIGRALLIRPGLANDELRETVAAIERVHGDGALPPIPVLTVGQLVAESGRLADGRFTFRPASNGHLNPVAISIRSRAAHRPFVLTHEVGHFLDACGLLGRGFTSTGSNRRLDDWRAAVDASRAVATLRALAEPGAGGDEARISRLTQVDELWARVYAQFIARRSGDASLQGGLDAVRQRPPSALYYPSQWDDDDFVEIDRAIEELFRGLGWMASVSPRTTNGNSTRS